MSSINKIQLPDGIEYEINDARIPSNETPVTQEWVEDQNYITLTEIPAASKTTDGLMSADDKSKLDKLMIEPALTLTFSSKPTEELPWITDGAIVAWESNTACKIYGITEIETNYPGATEVSPLLTTVEFGSCVTRIGTYTFEGCSSLTSISIPDSVTSIGNSTFRNCSSLTSVVIPASVSSIDEGAFSDCSSLTSVKILGSTTNIGYSAFAGCSALKTVVLNTIIPSDTSYYGAPFPETIAELIVPAASVNAYKTATGEYDTAGWSALSDKITAVATQEWVLEQGYGSSDLNLKNGEGACSLEQSFEEDGTVKGSKAYGKYATALNQNNSAYQRNSFVTGGGSEVGLTEEEFNEKYPNGVDEWDTTYDKSNSFANAGGQENKVKGRGSHIGGGYQNEVYGNYSGIVAGGSNIIEGTYSGVAAGYNNHVNGNNSGLLDGDNNLISGDNSGAGGVNNVIETDNTHAFGANLISNKRPDATMVGRYNNDKSYALFQVGSGWYNEETGVTHRRNSFEVFENGVNQFNESTIFAADVDFSNANVIGLPKFSFDATTGTLTIVSNGKN